jgi:hypothetical protein
MKRVLSVIQFKTNSYISLMLFIMFILIVGLEPLYNEIEQQIKLESLKEMVFLLEMRDDVLPLMAGANIMIMPSFFKGFPVVSAEVHVTVLRYVIYDSIASEVDLDLRLIQFLSLKEHREKWIDKMMIGTNKNINSEEIVNKLMAKSFDAAANGQWLAEFYKKL